MRKTELTIPELALIAGTRGALGAGLGLLLADRLSAEQRKAVGWTLVTIGVVTTIPLAFEVFGRNCAHELVDRTEDRAARSEFLPRSLI
jgi:hypothetical protein